MSPTETKSNKDDSTKGKTGKRRKRGGGRNWERKKTTKPKGPPQPPQVKFTIRNIHSADLNGTVKAVGERIVRKLILLSNEKLGVSSPTMDRIHLQLDETGFQALVKADEAARKALAEWNQKQVSEGNNPEEQQSDGKDDDNETMDIKSNTDADMPLEVVEGMENLVISKQFIDESTVHVRVLYIVPPKKTKRRGEKTGCAYLVLTAPPIEARDPLPTQPENLEGIAEDAASTRSTKSGSTQALVDYSQEVARRRIMIQCSMDALVKAAEEDAKTRQNLSECIVEESLNAKTWKARVVNTRRDRIEGTIEETADYKAFFEKLEQEKAERKSRPKPAPGGGMASTITSSNEDSKAQPVAAIVLHLRKKQEEERKRKQGKNKSKDGKKSSSSKNDTAAAGKKGKSKNVQKKKKKKAVSTGSAALSASKVASS